MPSDSISRRSFVGDIALAGAAFTIVPRHVLGGRGYLAPSDTLNVACIGVGGRGEEDVKGVSKEGENIYALCDVDLHSADKSFRAYPKAKKYRDYREMLDKEASHIDAVTVAIPDHSHAAAAMLAMKHGKHVYCEKPLARTMGEVQALMDGARRYKVATQMGNQGHAGKGTRLIREIVEAGWIGDVREVHYWTDRPIWPQGLERPLEVYEVPAWLDWNLWLGPAPVRPYHPAYAPFRWRGWWDFGCGALGDIAAHAMDAAFWTLSLGFPSRIEAETTRLYDESAPKLSRIVYHFDAKGPRGPVRVLWHDGGLAEARPRDLPPEYEWPEYADVGSQLWIGSDGMLVADCYGESVRLLDAKKQAELEASPPPEKYERSPGVYAEWIRACKGGAPAGSSFAEYSGPLTKMVLLGNLAIRMNQALELNPASGEITNAAVPPEWVRPTYRKGWEL